MSNSKNKTILLLEGKLLTQGDASILSFKKFLVNLNKSNCLVNCAKDFTLQELRICLMVFT